MMDNNIYEKMMENSPISCSLVSLVKEGTQIVDFITVKANCSFEIETGFKKENIVDKKMTEIFPDFVGRTKEQLKIMNKVYKEKTRINFVSYIQDLKKWFRIHFVYYDEDFMTLYLKDITKDYEESLNKKTELLDALKKAEEASLAKTRFIANISHEIRTPIHGIMGFTNLLEMTSLNEEQMEYLEYINMATKSLQTTVNNILDMTSIESREMKLKYLQFNLKDIVEEIIVKYEKIANEKGLEVVYQIKSDDDYSFIGDEVKLKTVVSNILDNSIKFTIEGKVNVDVYIRKLDNFQSEILMTFSDTGIGMMQEDLIQIFKPFVQLDDTSTRNFGGSGMGLYIAKKIVDAMEGKISVKSSPGVGSEVVLRIILDKAK